MKKKSFKRIAKRMTYIILIASLAILFVTIYANWKIQHDTQKFVHDTVDSIPSQKAAMILGCSPKLRGGYPNLYFTHRIQAAVELYNAGKVKVFVVSGDNGHSSYNEPEYMHDALVEKGIPDSIIYLDYAGFRTLDSVIRMKEIFSQSSYIIVSQEFHNERAIYTAQHYGITAYGYNAKDVALSRVSYKTKIREKLARVKTLVDIITGKQPKFLGEKIDIQ